MQCMDTEPQAGARPGETARPAVAGGRVPRSGLRNADGSPVTTVEQLEALIAPMTVAEWAKTPSAATASEGLRYDLARTGVLPQDG